MRPNGAKKPFPAKRLEKMKEHARHVEERGKIVAEAMRDRGWRDYLWKPRGTNRENTAINALLQLLGPIAGTR